MFNDDTKSLLTHTRAELAELEANAARRCSTTFTLLDCERAAEKLATQKPILEERIAEFERQLAPVTA